MKKKLSCSACKAAGKIVFGHWHSDDVCPQKGAKRSNSTFVTAADEDDDSEEDEIAEAFQVQLTGSLEGREASVLMQSKTMRHETANLALSDTCCARSVAGEGWMRKHMQYMVEN